MNICIVDDDKYVVEKIVEGMEWEKWNIDGVFTAYNIKQAKEILSIWKSISYFRILRCLKEVAWNC